MGHITNVFTGHYLSVKNHWVQRKHLNYFEVQKENTLKNVGPLFEVIFIDFW